MKDRTRQRLQNIDARFGERIRQRDGALGADRDAFVRAFRLARDAVIEPVFREVCALLEARGYRAVVEMAEGSKEVEGPSITLRAHLTARRPEGHRVAFVVIERGSEPEVLALLEAAKPVTDIARYKPEGLTSDVVEQVVADALEHIFACVAELP